MLRVVVTAISLVFFAGCGHNIGDSCISNVDCDPTGLRFCDTAPPGGYCTIDGCDVATCPSEAVCIRFFTPLPNEPCYKDVPDDSTRQGNMSCRVDARCVCDAAIGEACPFTTVKENEGTPMEREVVVPNGHCAPETTERRWCQRMCDKDTDCRPGYTCRATGTLGAEIVPAMDGGATTARFCAPMP